MFGKKKESRAKVFKDIYIVSGFDVPDKSPCVVELGEETVTIKCLGNNYVLSIDRIVNLDYKMDVDISQYTKNGSLVKGVVGGAAFGVAGAIIGASSKSKEKREVICTNFITYRSESINKTIVLANAPNAHTCASLHDSLRPMVKITINRVEL